MDEAARARLEDEIRGLCRTGDHRAAATVALRGYGPEVFGFLRAMLAGEEDPGDAFSDFAEAFWRGLPDFAWESSARTWAYGIARNVSHARRRVRARARRRVTDGDSEQVERIAAQVRTETLSFLRTAKRTRLQALRDSLPEDDRMLLVLRVDRELPWEDLARVFSGELEEAPDDVSVAREAARLRKRFQIVKKRLREMARAEGLLD